MNNDPAPVTAAQAVPGPAWLAVTARLAVIAVALILAGLLVADCRRTGRHTGARGVAAADPQREAEQALFYVVRASTPDMMVLDVSASEQIEAGYSGSSSKYVAQAIRNQRFIRMADGTQSTLFPHNRYLIASITSVGPKTSSGYQSRVEPELDAVARVYQVVTADTDGDKRLTGNDAKSIMIADKDGSRLTILADNVEGAHGTIWFADGEVRLLVNQYRKPVPLEAKPVIPAIPAIRPAVQSIVRFDVVAWKALPVIDLPSTKAE